MPGILPPIRPQEDNAPPVLPPIGGPPPDLGQPTPVAPSSILGNAVSPGQPIAPEQMHEAKMKNIGEQAAKNRDALSNLDWQDPNYTQKLTKLHMQHGELERQHAEEKMANPWGSPGNHPGILGKIGHGLATVGNVAGAALAPSLTAAIPGSKLNLQAQEAQGKAEEAAAGKEGQQAATTAKTEAEIPLTEAQTKEAEANAEAKLNPPDKSKFVIHETDQGVFRVDPTTGEAEPLTFQGKPLMPKQGPDANKLAGEIAAQIGEKPTTPEYAGKTYATVGEAQAAWGKAAEEIKNREAAAAGASRGEAYGSFRPVAVIDPATGQLRYQFAGEAIKGGASPAAGGTQAMAKQAQFSEMHYAAGQARDAINNLDRPFTPEQIAKLTLAMAQGDPGVMKTEIETILGTQQLTPAQENFVVWIGQLNERALSLRNVAGMGQGSDQLRNAIRATLPAVRSGSKSLMNKQLDAFENQVSLLEKGVPGVNRPETAPAAGTTPAAPATPPAAGGFAAWKAKGGG